MDFTALRYFSETAHSRSIREASERLHVSPSAVSRQIAKLEHELRAPIFHRRSQGMTLTAAGEILRSKVDEMIREFTRVKSHIAALQNLQAGTVDIHGFQAAVESVVAPVLHDLHARYPDLVFNFTLSSTDEAIEALMNGAAEVGLIVSPPPRDLILSTAIIRDTIVAAVAPEHTLAQRKSVSLKEIAGCPLVLAEPSFGLRQQIDRVFDRHGIQPNISCATNSLILMKRIASLGNHCTLLTPLAVEEEVAAGMLTAVSIKEFMDEPLVYSVCVRKGRLLSPAAKFFLKAVVDFCRNKRGHGPCSTSD
jgi:DNA-binding transcriptional LysR family regulator